MIAIAHHIAPGCPCAIVTGEAACGVVLVGIVICSLGLYAGNSSSPGPLVASEIPSDLGPDSCCC